MGAQMVSEILTGLGAFKAMLDLAKGLKDVSDATARNAVAIELQEKILSAHAQQMTLVERVSELEEEVAHLKAWDAEKERYELTKVGDSSALVYTLKEGVESPEHPHQLCTNCFTDGKKSILQEEIHAVGRAHVLVCHRCGSELYTRGMRRQEHSGGRKRR